MNYPEIVVKIDHETRDQLRQLADDFGLTLEEMAFVILKKKLEDVLTTKH